MSKLSLIALLVLSGLPAGASAYTDQPAVIAQYTDPTCTIVGTAVSWNPSGTIDVTVDGSYVGSFSFNQFGSNSLSFDCSRGRHSFSFSIEGTAATCNGILYIGIDTNFAPAMRVYPYQSYCSLTPQ